MKQSRIPSDEEFARASAAMRKRSRGLSLVREQVVSQFRENGEIHEFFIMDCSEFSFRASVFYRWNRQIQEAKESGLEPRIIAATYDELEKAGRGDLRTIEVEFDFDSQENVEANFEGDYFLRLR